MFKTKQEVKIKITCPNWKRDLDINSCRKCKFHNGVRDGNRVKCGY